LEVKSVELSVGLAEDAEEVSKEGFSNNTGGVGGDDISTTTSKGGAVVVVADAILLAAVNWKHSMEAACSKSASSSQAAEAATTSTSCWVSRREEPVLQSVVDEGGYIAEALDPEEAFGATFVLDLPPMPPGATVYLKTPGPLV
jgi:hypothetical protein